MRNLSAGFVLALGLVVGCATEFDDDISTDIPEETDLGPKADQPELAFTPVDGLSLRSTVGRTEEGRVIRSRTAFKTAFGTEPPTWLDFSHEWLAVYSGGVRTTGGYKAEIRSVRLSDSGKSVKVVAHLSTPGEGCIVTQALTKPFAVVKFAAQPGASTSRFTKQSEAKACGGGACGSALASQLATAAQGMLYMSESDYPLTVVSWAGAGAPTIAKLRMLTNTPASTLVEERSFAETMDRLGEAYDPDDPFIVEYAAKYRALRAVMEQNLHNLTVIRIGEISIDVYFVGESACGELVGLKTTSIET